MTNDNDRVKEGDWVEILTTGQEGEVIEIHGDEYFDEIDNPGGDVDTFSAKELKKF